MSANYPKRPTKARQIVADEARQIRQRFRASRLAVSKNIDEMARGARGLKLGDHLDELAATMLSGPYTVAETEEVATRIALRIVRDRARMIA